MTKQVFCGNVPIGGGAPVSIQSMLNVKTTDVDVAVEQINRLKEAGCQIVRLAVPDMEGAKAFGEIKKQVDMPLVADIHFDYRLALESIFNGADKIRINPGNIGGKDKVKAVVMAAMERKIPIRIGVNSGSLEKSIIKKYGGVTAEGLVESAMGQVNYLEEMGFNDIVISLKSSNVVLNHKAYMAISAKTDYPLHIGVTEAGTIESGKIKSAVGIGALLLAGIGDTMRVSLTGNPLEEVMVAQKILSAVGLRQEGINIISCPTCGRTRVNLESIANEVEKRLQPISKKRMEAGLPGIDVAIMGCEVNGPGEASEAHIGVACGKGRGVIFAKGQIIKTVDEEDIIPSLMEIIEEI